MNLNRTLKLAFVLLAAMVLTMAIYGFAAANTVPAGNAGDGNAAITGYVITSVHYVLDPADPTMITSMTFVVAPAVPAGGTVYVKLVTGGTYQSCVAAGVNVTCTFTAPGISVLSADNLRVIAAQ
jgi:hypothetical protein